MRARRRLAFLAMAAMAAACAPRPSPHAIVLVTLDTVRSDRVLGPARLELPSLERAFARGARYPNAMASSPVTGPSHATILTGVPPFRHGVLTNGTPLDAQALTLPEILRAAGYRTAAFVSCSILRAGQGFDQGFETYDDRTDSRYAPRVSRRETERAGSATTDAALSWLGGHERRPFFLWVHYFDAHAPYAPPAAYRPPGRERLERRFGPVEEPTVERLSEIHRDSRPLPDEVVQYYRGLYDGEIRAIDAALGRLLSHLERAPYARSVLLVVTADHGEELYEHDRFFEHSLSLHDTVMRVPLMLAGPGVPEGTHLEQVSNGSVVATVLDAARIEAPPDLRYPSLLDRRAASPPELFMLKEPHRLVLPWGVAVRRPPWRYITWEDGTEKLYDIESDPGETVDVASRHPELTAELRSRIRTEVVEHIDWGRLEKESRAPVDPETLSILKSLGYVR